MTTATEFAAKITEGDANLDRLASAINDEPGTWTTSEGVVVPNLRQRLSDVTDAADALGAISDAVSESGTARDETISAMAKTYDSLTAALADTTQFADGAVLSVRGGGTYTVVPSGGDIDRTDGEHLQIDTSGAVNVEYLGIIGDYFLADGSVNPSPTDWTDEINAAIVTFKRLYFPARRGYLRTGYYCGDIEMVTGATIIADGRPKGQPSSGITAIADGSAVFVSNGCPTHGAMFNQRTNSATQCAYLGVIIWGRDKSVNGIDVTKFRTITRDCQIIECLTGIGGVSSVYGDHSNHFNMHLTNCITGVSRSRDSKFIGGRVSSCDYGVNLPSGANNNRIGLKMDFNTVNLKATDVDGLMIDAEVIDRSERTGIELIRVTRFTVVSNFWRNGSDDTVAGGDKEAAHLYMEDCGTGVVMMTTGHGTDDGGGGFDTPKYSVAFGGTANTNITIVGDLSGCTSERVKIASGTDIRSVEFVGDSLWSKSRDATEKVVSLAVSGSGSASVTTGYLHTFRRRRVDIRLSARRSDGDSNSPSVTIPAVIKIGAAGSATIEAGTGYGEIDSGATYFGSTITYSISVSTDGRVVTVSLTNTSGTISHIVTVEVT